MKNNKLITLYVLFSVLFFAASYARADQYSSIVYEQSPVSSGTIINNETANGAALAIAMSQLSFDWSTKNLQAGVGLGSFDSQDAISFGLGKRVDRLLINGSVGREGNNYGYGLGINWHF